MIPRRGLSIYAGLLTGTNLRDEMRQHLAFSLDPSDSGFEKTLSLVSERHELLLLAAAMSEYILSNDLESSFRSFIFGE